MDDVKTSAGRPVAVVTGASSGIGAAFATLLAREGFDLVLVARRETRLRELAARLELAQGVRVEVIVADLTAGADLRRLAARIPEIDHLDLLVNNAGFGTASRFAQVDLSKQLEMIQLHVTATVVLIHAALEGMLARRRGSIINVSSIAGWIPRPGNANYSATKAYLTTFTRALAKELRGTGVRAQALCPGFTLTEFHDSPEYAGFDRRRVPQLLWMTAEDVAARSLRGLESGRAVLIPGWQNRLIVPLATSRLGQLVLRSSRFALQNRKR